MSHQEREYLDAIIAERDEAREELIRLSKAEQHYVESRLRAEAEVARLREALTKLAESAESCVNVDDTTLREEWVVEVARAALGEDA